MNGFRKISEWVSSDAVTHLVYEPLKSITVKQFLKQHENIKLITVGFVLVDKDRKPVTPMIHFGKGVIRPGVWGKEYYSKKIKKVYLTDAYAELDYEIEVAE